MLDYLKFLDGYINVPAAPVVTVIVIFIGMQIIGELIEFKGKIAPEWMKLRKKRARKRKEEEELKRLLREATVALKEYKTTLSDFLSKYNDDNIAKRNVWMKCVDKGIAANATDIHAFKDRLDEIYDISIKDHIETLRSIILNFASKVADPNYTPTHEEFRRAIAAHGDYEAFLQKHKLKNGQTDIAYRVISEAYAECLRDHRFLEDIRGYEM